MFNPDTAPGRGSYFCSAIEEAVFQNVSSGVSFVWDGHGADPDDAGTRGLAFAGWMRGNCIADNVGVPGHDETRLLGEWLGARFRGMWD
jgi:hypothetical protein